MTDESLFYRRFIDDVRRCAAGRAPASAVEIDQRVQAALTAPPQQRESRWARVVAAVAELLSGFNDRSPSAGRLRAFLRENADLERPHDVAITDFRFVQRVDGVLQLRDGRRVLMFARIPRVASASLDEVVAVPARRAAELTVYGLCGGAAVAALWFAFIVPL